MTTEKQIAANRENAKKSTATNSRRQAPVSAKHRPARLTAETIIDVLEEAADYEALAAAINADFRPATNFELQLIARLISLLWRLRRATAIESGLLALEAEGPATKGTGFNEALSVFYGLFFLRHDQPNARPQSRSRKGERRLAVHSRSSVGLGTK